MQIFMQTARFWLLEEKLMRIISLYLLSLDWLSPLRVSMQNYYSLLRVSD